MGSRAPAGKRQQHKPISQAAQWASRQAADKRQVHGHGHGFLWVVMDTVKCFEISDLHVYLSCSLATSSIIYIYMAATKS